jgi:hypothetical protein
MLRPEGDGGEFGADVQRNSQTYRFVEETEIVGTRR